MVVIKKEDKTDYEAEMYGADMGKTVPCNMGDSR